MKSFRELLIVNEKGLHARAAAVLVRVANRYQSEVLLELDGERVNGKSILGVLLLAAAKGSLVRVTVEGPDHEIAIEALDEIFAKGFREEEPPPGGAGPSKRGG